MTASSSEARKNWTSMCRDVVNSGKWKSRWSDENIHLLYWGLVRTCVLQHGPNVLTIDIDKENKYHKPIRAALMRRLRITNLSAESLCASLPSPAIRASRSSCWRFRSKCFCCSSAVSPVSSSISDLMSSISCSSLSDIDPGSSPEPDSSCRLPVSCL